ncbi:HAMP domain-containing histidine kinase (plasmid) [Clostridium estertheticum]|uniref:sensor histidine kinase n=1 Tax=Clostridium estertheticum TaxID=238834 RepID=UPI001C7DB6BB|nr:HAMP domain-containing sensor histidine kinase [Clostridium estertheticum]MBX4260340.1 HAMP domain-containing histidine kinase [Clostridium estertheticum]WLC72770.1 HAMP domain-containing histidine kinase [Clostridium estertheticum]
MKIKKWNWNFYILAFFIFIGLMLFINLKMKSNVAEFLKDIVIGSFLLLAIIVYYTSRYSKITERKKIINQLEQRISLLSKGEVPEKVQELKIIDSEINELRHENELVKQEILMEMSKKNDLVTYLAHDLKTPLTSIVGYLTILDESEVPEKVRRDYIKKLLEKSYKMEDLTNQFFDITRFSLQEIPLNKSLLDASFFLEQLTEELYPLLKEKNLKFDINLTPSIKIYVDGSLFARVLNNLLKNAIAYSHKDSVIKIKTETGKCSMKLFVENDGDVISQQELKLIFEKFYRRDQSRSQSNGAGLGLAIAREIVQKHQGSLDAESQDGHTVFIITLPNS